MEQVYEQQMTVGPGDCDISGRLSYHDSIRLFVDSAAAHAEHLDCGLGRMREKKYFWLTVKTKAEFTVRPRMGERFTLRTWPEVPGKLRCIRSYEIVSAQGERMIAGKTEWAVMDLESGRLVPMEGIYGAGLSFTEPTACPAPFAHVPEKAEDYEAYAEYTVRSTDIDMGRHMNNVAYVRTLLGSFSNEALKQMRLRSMDVIYRTPCFEGETLRLLRRKTEAGTDVCFLTERGPVFLAHLEGTP